jgi:hypothetical protein
MRGEYGKEVGNAAEQLTAHMDKLISGCFRGFEHSYNKLERAIRDGMDWRKNGTGAQLLLASLLLLGQEPNRCSSCFLLQEHACCSALPRPYSQSGFMSHVHYTLSSRLCHLSDTSCPCPLSCRRSIRYRQAAAAADHPAAHGAQQQQQQR